MSSTNCSNRVSSQYKEHRNIFQQIKLFGSFYHNVWTENQEQVYNSSVLSIKRFLKLLKYVLHAFDYLQCILWHENRNGENSMLNAKHRHTLFDLCMQWLLKCRWYYFCSEKVINTQDLRGKQTSINKTLKKIFGYKFELPRIALYFDAVIDKTFSGSNL